MPAVRLLIIESLEPDLTAATIGGPKDGAIIYTFAWQGWRFVHCFFRRSRSSLTGAAVVEAFRPEALSPLRMESCGIRLWSNRGRVRIKSSINPSRLG
jgi:hypothetical protein